MTEMFQEYFDSRGVAVRVDRSAAVIRGVKVLGLESRNGRSYSPDAIAQAVPLYEDAKVNINHPKGDPAGPRDYQDRIGQIRNVAVRPGEGLFADFHFNPKHAMAEQLIWDAEHSPENVGFSHNVEARTSRQGDRVTVEAITRVQSVDLVADPATTRGLFESSQSNIPPQENTTGDIPSSSTTVSPAPEAGQHNQPKTVERLCMEGDDPVRNLYEENARLKEMLRQNTQQQTARRLLQEHHLPSPESAEPLAKTIVSREFFDSLLAALDEKAMRSLVEERARLVQSLAGHSMPNQGEIQPCSRDQYLISTTAPIDSRSFVEAIT